jgi:hypothetical protein
MLPAEEYEAFRTTLLAGGYNVLIGSGLTRGSTNGRHEQMLVGETLRDRLCTLTGAPGETPLARVVGLLTPDQVDSELTERYSHCNPASSLGVFTRFLWKRLYTLNIDDCVQSVYAHSDAPKQAIRTVNYRDHYQPSTDRRELQVIHLHGFVGRASDGYVFSPHDYARVMSGNNPWLHILTESLATEPFIISGASLNEPDLEYFLSYRTPSTPRRGRGPSLLVTPHPSVVTAADCERLGLTLVTAAWEEFANWLDSMFPGAPTIEELTVPDVSELFEPSLSRRSLVRLFADFDLVTAGDAPQPGTPSAFLYGREPTWRELHQHLDLERTFNDQLLTLLKDRLAESSGADDRVVAVLDTAGSGKTTAIRRAAVDLARLGIPVLALRSAARIDVAAVIECVEAARRPLALLVDSLADHVEQVAEIIEDAQPAVPWTIIGAERSYRREHLDVVFGRVRWLAIPAPAFGFDEYRRLLERYVRFGLVGDSDAVRHPERFARRLAGDPVAIAICRIMNDFRPIDSIVSSLWEASDDAAQRGYLAVAIAQHCYRAGLRYSIAQTVVGPLTPIAGLTDPDAPLPLTTLVSDDEFVVTLNGALGEQVLQRAVTSEPDLLYDVYRSLATALAPHVNRLAIQRRTPEARLSRRLLEGDQMKSLLGTRAEQLLIDIHAEWRWNSRYWEQRALLGADADLPSAIAHARQAVSIEDHPFPLTTLASLLIKDMTSQPSSAPLSFKQAFASLSRAIEMEHSWGRSTVHPYHVLFTGAATYLEMGHVLSSLQTSAIEEAVHAANFRFPSDRQLDVAVARLVELGLSAK